MVSQNEVISQLRFPLIVLVTYAHSYGGVSEGFSLLCSEWNTYEFLKLLVSQTLVKVCVPVFFVISGYLFFARNGEWSWHVYGQKLKRRVWSLLLPYLVWNLLMGIKLHHITIDTFWAPADMPLWFLRDLIFLSLSTPIIYWGFRWLGNGLLVLLLLAYTLCPTVFSVSDQTAYAVFFFSLGAFVGIRKWDLVESMYRCRWPACILFVLLAVAMLFTYGTGVFLWVMLCFRLVSVPAVFCFARYVLKHTTWRQPVMLIDASYFIYLAHYVFFMSFIDTAFFRLAGQSVAVLSVHYLLCPLVKVLLFVVAYGGFSVLRRHRYVAFFLINYDGISILFRIFAHKLRKRS